jgi:methylenetetrahydrofolate dehydrogenase (NADP+) / methenyltetrahydrofolate cyclohydrolase
MVGRDWIKPGATSSMWASIAGPDGKQRLVGDVAFAEVAQIADAITPVPG